MTQKDSQDDIGDGPAPPPAEAQPGHPEKAVISVSVAPEPSGARSLDAAPARPDQSFVSSPDDVPELPGDAPAIDKASDAQTPANDDAPVGPYLRQYAKFVTLPVDRPAPVSLTDVATPAPAVAAAEIPAEPPVDAQPPTQPHDEELPPIDSSTDDAPPPPSDDVAAPHEAPSAPVPDDAVPEPPPHFAADAPITIIRRAWDRPPPMAATPPWVWRDVTPDIVQRPGELALRTDTEPPTTAAKPLPTVVPDPAVTQRVTPPAEPIPSAEPSSPPDAIDPAARYETRLPPDTPIETISHRDPIATALPAPPVRREPPAPAPTPPAPPPASSVPEPLTAWRAAEQPPAERIEPQWQRRPEPYAAFRDARPGDHARDGFAAPPATNWDRYKDYGRIALRYAGYAIGGYFALVFVLILLYRVVNPPASSLMLIQALTGTDVRQEWVPLEDISPSLVRAVIVSEDWSFCEHYGIDIKAIEQAIEKSGNGIPRGASTISMQTTKNLFLWNAKSYIRKAVELPLTLMIELIWPKSRILEIYLNVAEWGPGIFGAEAAARYHFDKPASRLGEREAAQLAASLPNPIVREAGDPGPRTARKASVIQARMRNAGGAAACVLGGR